jgi:hypothetical protein
MAENEYLDISKSHRWRRVYDAVRYDRPIGQIPGPLIDLYRRYRREWLLLVERGLREAWKWSQIMVPRQSEQTERQYA